MTNPTPLNPDAPDSQVSENQRVEVIETPERDYPSHGSVTISLHHSERQSTTIQIAERTAESLRDQLNKLLAAAQPEAQKLTDAEWQAFQAIPDQGYSHRAWVDARIAERVALAAAQPEGWEQQAKNFMRVIDRLTAENEALKAAEQKAHSDAGWAANMDRQGGA